MSSNKDFQITDEMVRDFLDIEFSQKSSQELINRWEAFKTKRSSVEEMPVPLFTTEDGKGIYIGDRVYYLRVWGVKSWIVSGTFDLPDKPLKTFSTEQAANEYITMNKPLLSVNDCCDLYDVWAFEKKDTWRNALKHLVQSKITTP